MNKCWRSKVQHSQWYCAAYLKFSKNIDIKSSPTPHTCTHKVNYVVVMDTLFSLIWCSFHNASIYVKTTKLPILKISQWSCKKSLMQGNTVSPLHMKLQVVNFQRCKRASGSSKEPEPLPSTSGMSEIAAWPLSPIADNPSALPSPTSSPSSSQ